MNCDLEGKFAVTCSGNGTAIRLWNVDKGTKVASYVLEQSGLEEIYGLYLSQSGLISAFTHFENELVGRLSVYRVDSSILEILVGLTADDISQR